jgi:tetratricopeptide (TPR) repeat protein
MQELPSPVLRQVEKMKPDFAEVLDWEALAYQQMHDYENALSCFNRAIELNPNNCVSLVNRAALLFRLKKFQQAYEDIQTAKQKGCFIPPALITDIEHFYKK